ncbi:hypothetical protein CR513_44738, partial [Mucuna pruriens]
MKHSNECGIWLSRSVRDSKKWDYKIGRESIDVQRDAYRESKKKNCKVLYLIQQSLDAANFEKIGYKGLRGEVATLRNLNYCRWRTMKLWLNSSPRFNHSPIKCNQMEKR